MKQTALDDYISSFENSYYKNCGGSSSSVSISQINLNNKSSSSAYISKNNHSSIFEPHNKHSGGGQQSMGNFARFSIDEIPTKENSKRTSVERDRHEDTLQIEAQLMNFKEFYEQSKQENPSKVKKENFGLASNMRSKSSIMSSRMFESSQLSQNGSLLIKPTIQYNINEYLPSSSTNHKINSSVLINANHSILQQQHQSQVFGNKPLNPSYSGLNILQNQATLPQVTNIFKHNIQQSVSQHQNPNLYKLNQLNQSPNRLTVVQSQQQLLMNSQCSCQRLPLTNQMLQTQRSSCSCLYSQGTSSCHSAYASPLSSSCHRGGRGSRLQQQQSQPYVDVRNQKASGFNAASQLQQMHQNITKIKSQAQLSGSSSNANPSYQNQIFTSNESTPFKRSAGLHPYAQPTSGGPTSNKSPNLTIKQPNSQGGNSNNRLFEDRSISFLRSSDKKEKTMGGGGYNTDDLLRDTESEVDLNQVSNILQEVQINFQEGIRSLMKKSQPQLLEDERRMKEELAMKILQQQNQNYIPENMVYSNGVLNESQIKTIKQNGQPKGPILTLESLELPGQQFRNQIQTPSILKEINLTPINESNHQDITQTNKFFSNGQVITPVQQLHLTSHLNALQQQYQSPCFNNFEDSTQNMATFQQHQLLFQGQLQQQHAPNQQHLDVQQFQQPPQPTQSNTTHSTANTLGIYLNTSSSALSGSSSKKQDHHQHNHHQNYNSVPSSQMNGLQSSKQKKNGKKSGKSKRRKSVGKKLSKKNYNEEDYSHRKLQSDSEEQSEINESYQDQRMNISQMQEQNKEN